jgi:hypothetical protein
MKRGACLMYRSRSEPIGEEWESGGEGGPLRSEPNTRFSWNMRHVDNLEVGRRRDGGGLNGHSKGACEGTELVTLAGNTGGGRSVA